MNAIEELLARIQAAIQVDVGGRGLARDPAENLLTATAGDFAAACASFPTRGAATTVGIVTGFMIPSADPPVGETDGPPGALFLADVLRKLRIPVVLASDGAGYEALRLGARDRRLTEYPVIDLRKDNLLAVGHFSHLIAVERSGPGDDGLNRTMRGHDITSLTWPAHELFEGPRKYKTIGIGDGGNEIGMGKIPRHVIAKNIPDGDRVACRTATDHLIVSGTSNWGCIGLAAGIMLATGRVYPDMFEPERELFLLERLVKKAPLIDGVTGQFTATVDGIPFERYAEPMRAIRELLETCSLVSRPK